MGNDQKLLQEVASNARMGIEAVDLLLSKTGDGAIVSELRRQREQYGEIQREAEQKLYAVGGQAPAESPIQRAGAWVGVQANTLIDRTPSHMADMLIQGSAMGIIAMSRARNQSRDADPDALDLADRLIDVSVQGMERSREFL